MEQPRDQDAWVRPEHQHRHLEGQRAAAAGGRSRREFLTAAAAVAVGAAVLPSLLATREVAAAPSGGPVGCYIGPLSPTARAQRARDLRNEAAQYEYNQPLPAHGCNGDEDLYPNKIASFSKALKHNALGEVDPRSYDALIKAIKSGKPEDFEAIPRGGTRQLKNPQAAFAFELQGPDSHQLAVPPAPLFASAHQAAEVAENYWEALVRDIRYADYGDDPLIDAACDDLSSLSDFRGPKVQGKVTPQTIFRIDAPGCLEGPYISQFFLKAIPYATQIIDQRMKTRMPGTDYVTTYEAWIATQLGAPFRKEFFQTNALYIRTGRDLASWVWEDVAPQAYFNALLILHGLGAPTDPNDPYRTYRGQNAFATFGAPYAEGLVPYVGVRSFKPAWSEKWTVHRRLRPEVFGGRIHNHMTSKASYPIHADILNSPVLGRIFSKWGTYLLPQAYIEGSPAHPAYPSGHATVAGACVTVLKALFDESWEIPEPVQPSSDGNRLVSAGSIKLTVGGELNKLAMNVAMGRNYAGIHWRTDAEEGIKLGEEFAIRFLREEKMTLNEEFPGWKLTRFDGTSITV